MTLLTSALLALLFTPVLLSFFLTSRFVTPQLYTKPFQPNAKRDAMARFSILMPLKLQIIYGVVIFTIVILAEFFQARFLGFLFVPLFFSYLFQLALRARRELKKDQSLSVKTEVLLAVTAYSVSFLVISLFRSPPT